MFAGVYGFARALWLKGKPKGDLIALIAISIFDIVLGALIAAGASPSAAALVLGISTLFISALSEHGVVAVVAGVFLFNFVEFLLGYIVGWIIGKTRK